jgi:hypothetical protein
VLSFHVLQYPKIRSADRWRYTPTLEGLELLELLGIAYDRV